MTDSNPPQVLLFGSTGRLGRELAMHFAKAGFDCWNFARVNFDLLETEKVQYAIMNALQPGRSVFIVNASAYNGLEQCEANPSHAIAVNCLAPAVMAQVARDVGAFFIHYSTDYTVAHNGNEDCAALPENAPYSFRSAYGTSKLLGEVAVQDICNSYCIFRLSSIYGLDLAGSLEVVKQVRDRGRGSAADPIQVLHQYATPTSVKTIASVTTTIIHRLMETRMWRRASGVYNMVSTGPVWKADFAQHAVEQFLGKKDMVVKEGRLMLPRPTFCVLDNSKIQGAFQIEMPTTMADLMEMAQAFKMGQAKVH